MGITIVNEAVVDVMLTISQVQRNHHPNDIESDAEIPQHEQNDPPEGEVTEPM